MDISYMERLSMRSPYDRGNDGVYNSNLLTKLVRNYRSHPSILKLPNEMFYDNELQQCGDHFVTNSMARWEHLPKKGFPVMFHAISGENLREANSPSWFNPQEAQEVVNYVDLLAKHSMPRVDPAEIGVVTPYARQAQKIRLALKTRDLGDVKVGSVETFQGQERRVIIISTVRAENDYVDHDKKYNLGFVSNKKRFNVAVTRAQALLIIVGQPQVLATDKETWLPLLRMCRDNQSWVGEEWVEGSDASKDEDDLLASVPEENTNEASDDDWVIFGMDRLGISQAVEQEGLGYINREE
uniref:RNA helicase n=1 Tax=Helicotheca tamesis TaxID=374047 RepID=A0A7S2N5D6_9STRA|mmetsp:Transcript_9814/g.13723  ORF Transcript_9814/g.13723 Transcript_9814/m.13723 type:complete len:298 (+) Transcript_9814:118-1011(+)